VTDRELLDRFSRRRDVLGEAAFAALVARHGPMVWGVCHRTLRDHADVGDACQASSWSSFTWQARSACAIRSALAAWREPSCGNEGARSRIGDG
jgi:RNA polymerase sigma-70 factor (ECF subfamily)